MNHKSYTNTTSLFNRVTGLKIMISMAILLLSYTKINGQVADYTFTQSPGTYAPLGPARNIVFTATPGAVTDPGLGDNRNFPIPIPFPFSFDGITYNQMNINTNGFVTFGFTLPLTTDRNGLSNSTAYSGCIAAHGSDLCANTNPSNLGEISFELLGTGNNRTFAIQYSKYRRFSISNAFTEDYNFQFKLDEGGGNPNAQRICVSYGPCVSTPLTGFCEVGLRGATNNFAAGNINNRQNPSTGWNASIPGVANNSAMRHFNTVNPASGQTYIWNPPLPPVPECVNSPIFPSNGSADVDPCNVVLNWPSVPGATGYDVYFDQGNGPATTLISSNQFETFFTLGMVPDIASPLAWCWIIVPRNETGPATGCNNFTFTTTVGSPLPCYLPSAHLNGCAMGDEITNVVLHTLNNPSGCSNNTYTFYPEATTTLKRDTTYTLTVSFGSDPYQYFGAWIDYNHDADFSPAELLGISGNAGPNGTASITFTVPADADTGRSRLRLVGGNDGFLHAFLVANDRGETEDYDIFISSSTPQPPMLNLNLLLQGYYTNPGSPTPMDNFGAGGCLYLDGQIDGFPASFNDVDSIRISLIDSVIYANTFDIVAGTVESQTGILQTDGTLSITFTTSGISGNSYYLKVEQRSHVETWSAETQLMSPVTYYDFTDDPGKSYMFLGNPFPGCVEVQTGVWAIYAGDIFRDGVVDITDIPVLTTQIESVFPFGYQTGDLNGDGFIDFTDIPILTTNIDLGIYSQHP